jgi:hypothetical protein
MGRFTRLAVDRGQQAGAAIDVRKGTAQAEVVENQFIGRLGQNVLCPTIPSQTRDSDLDAILLEHEHATAVGMALVDLALALDGLAVAARNDLGGEIEAIRVALLVVTRVDYDDVRLRIVVRRNRCEVQPDALIGEQRREGVRNDV